MMCAGKKWYCLPIYSSGLSLVETIIAMALMGFLMLSISNILIKSNVTTASMSTRIKEAAEVHALIDDIRQDLLKGAYISADSYDLRLDYTIPDVNGSASRKVYSIVNESGKYYLKLSKDGGTTWISPYRVSAYNKYQVGSLAKFLYADLNNNCTQFTDIDSDGNIDEDTDDWADNRDIANCMNQPILDSWFPLPKATVASSVVLRNFRFTTGTGSPESIYPLPYTSTGKEWNNATMSWIASMDNSDVFLKVNPALVRSTVTPVSPLVKNPAALQSFATNTDDSMYGTAFDVRGITWDPSRRRLIVVGRHSSGDNQIFQADRNGVLIGEGLGLTTSDGTIQLDGVAVEGTGNIILVLDNVTNKVYRYNLNSPEPLVPLTSIDLTSLPYNIKAIAYDSSTPDDFYVVGNHQLSSETRILQLNKYTGAEVAGPWVVYSDGSRYAGSIFVEPLTGDFIVAQNYAAGTDPFRRFNIFRVPRSGSATSYEMNLSDIGIFLGQEFNQLRLAYDPVLNRFFITSISLDKVYEVLPDRLITAR